MMSTVLAPFGADTGDEAHQHTLAHTVMYMLCLRQGTATIHDKDRSSCHQFRIHFLTTQAAAARTPKGRATCTGGRARVWPTVWGGAACTLGCGGAWPETLAWPVPWPNLQAWNEWPGPACPLAAGPPARMVPALADPRWRHPVPVPVRHPAGVAVTMAVAVAVAATRPCARRRHLHQFSVGLGLDQAVHVVVTHVVPHLGVRTHTAQGGGHGASQHAAAHVMPHLTV